MNQNLQKITLFLQQDESISVEEKASLTKAVADAEKEMEITTFKLDRTEKVKRTTAILLEETIEELEQKRKAVEAQNRDLEIEAALEKIRSRSLAMHKSDELWEVVAVVFEKFQELKFSIDGAAFIATFIEGSRAFNCWLASDQDQSYPTILKLPHYDTPTLNDMWLAKESGLDFFSKTYSIEEKNPWLSYAFEHTDLKIITDEFKNWMLEQPFLTQSLALGKNSLIGIHFHHQRTLSETEVDILKRFSKVFDQAYIRFLDLQKAEAQARESEIELALERVRAKTMAMQKSEELTDTAAMLFQQINELDIHQWGNAFQLWDDDMKAVTSWTGNQGGNVSLFKIPATEDPIMINIVNAAQKRESLYVEAMGGEALESHYKYMTSLPGLKEVFEKLAEDGFTPPKFQVFHAAYFSSGYILFITHEPVPEAHEIFKRFAKVFEQTYTRFLDLQKAEAQAREAQIELALERVRARTMAMQKSEELQEVANTIYERLHDLRVEMDFANLISLIEGSKDYYVWVNGLSKPIRIPFNDVTEVQRIYNDLMDRKCELFTHTFSGEMRDEYYKFLLEQTDLGKSLSEDQKKHFLESPFNTASLALTKNTCIQLVRLSDKAFSKEDNEILKRFVKVFEQAYTRFLDLQKAEEQAREAQIEVALERVRARTMAMQRSEELAEVATILFQQVKALGVPQWACGFNIWEIGDKEYTFYPGSPDGSVLKPFKVPLTGHWVFSGMEESRKKGEDFFMYEKEGEKQEEHYRYMLSLSGGMGELLQNMLDAGMQIPKFQIDHLANFSHGNLMFITFEPVPEMWDVFKRFAKVFEQTYTRFLDLQKAEAQARESQIQLAMERVRARTMAMQHSDELADASHLLERQVAALGIKTWGCAFHIFRENDSLEYHSNADGVLPTFVIPRTYIWQRYYEACQRGETLIIEERVGEACTELYEYMAAMPIVGEELQKMKAAGIPFPTYQVEHAASFKYGYLLFITFEQVPEAHDIFIRFAKVFEQTYTRFLDLQKAEAQAREAQIQLALERVRARTMAMQKSDELSETVAVLFHQFNALGEKPERMAIEIVNEKENVFDIWATQHGGSQLNQLFKASLDEPHVMQKMYKAWKEQTKSITIDLQGKELEEYFQYLKNEGLPVQREIFGTRRVQNVATFAKGILTIITLVSRHN